MARFLLVAYDQVERYAAFSPEQMQAMVERYMVWTRDIAARGHLVLGEKLKDGTAKAVTRAKGSLSVSNGPFTEAREVVGGFWLLQCDDEAQAIAIADSCPHAEHGVLGLSEIEAM